MCVYKHIMLNVNKINDEKKRVNQRLTKDGIRKPNIPAIIEAVALTLDPKAYQDESSTIDQQLQKMEREKREKKLLQYQLKTHPQTVSNFLVNKYSDGNFNKAALDRYDNSEERKKLGITFDYHVYFKPEKEFNDRRANNRYVMSETIVDRTVGDNYTYHIPIWLDTVSSEVPFFVTDYGEVVNDPSSRGLLWALKELKEAIESRSFSVPPEADEILTQWGFLKNGKIVHDLKHGFMVEKYLKSIGNEDKKEHAIQYLDSMVKALNEDDDLGEWDDDDDIDIDEPTPPQQPEQIEEEPEPETAISEPKVDDGDETETKELEDPAPSTTTTTTTTEESVTTENVEQKDEKKEEKEEKKEEPVLKEVSEEKVPTKEQTAKGLRVTPTTPTTKTSLYQLAIASRVPTVTYTQLSRGNANTVRTDICIPLDGKLYVIQLRTGTPQIKLDSVSRPLFKYRQELIRWLEKGWIIPTEIPERVVELLKAKGFTDLIEGKPPKDTIHGFEHAIRK